MLVADRGNEILIGPEVCPLDPFCRTLLRIPFSLSRLQQPLGTLPIGSFGRTRSLHTLGRGVVQYIYTDSTDLIGVRLHCNNAEINC